MRFFLGDQSVQCAAMSASDFNYELPDELIAQSPLERRDASRLLFVPGQGHDYQELEFSQLGSLLRPGDLLILNDTRVIPGRLYGHKASGGRVEMLLERILASDTALVQLRSSRSPRTGTSIDFEAGIKATVTGRQDNFFVLQFNAAIEASLQQHGHVPLPPYIQRADNAQDRDRYQTVFARESGAVAAPTAGLHFDQALLSSLKQKGIEQAYVTLHVGAGTFLPLRDEQIASGRLHSERIEVSAAVCAAVNSTRERQGRVIAVGTTVVRALESAVVDGRLASYGGETDIFIRPGYQFTVVDAMITNFHLPGSSLLMLVSAFHGKKSILDAYKYAVARKFRFFSYGDAMFLERAS